MLFEPTSELGGIQRRTGYICDDPSSSRGSIHYLEVIKPLAWDCSTAKIDPNIIPVGSVTWAYSFDKGSSTHPEDNKLKANVESSCFRLIKTVLAGETVQSIDRTHTPNVKYRFKTKEEFIRENKWVNRESGGRDGGYPEHWASDGGMNEYLGKIVSVNGHEAIESAKTRDRLDRIVFNGWTFRDWNFIDANIVPPPREMPGVRVEVPPSWREPIQEVDLIDTPKFPGSIVPSPQLIQQESWGTVREKASLFSTSQQQVSDRYSKIEQLTDDFVIESTINITI